MSVPSLPALYIVPTPIGNRADMVPRAIEVLQSVDLIAVEDKRHSRPLLSHFDIRTPLTVYHDHSGEAALHKVMEALRGGGKVALISDAGTPLVSDPGYRLVDAVLAEGFAVVPIPGPCAAIVALSAAGLPSDRFCFEGFLPAKAAARAKTLEGLAGDTRTLIFYEAPHRLLDTVDAMVEIFGEERTAVLARELTKLFETIRRAPLAELRDWIAGDPNQQRGECVLLVHGAPDRPQSASTVQAEQVLRVLLAELPLKQAAKLAAQITGEKKNRLYELGLEIKPD